MDKTPQVLDEDKGDLLRPPSDIHALPAVSALKIPPEVRQDNQHQLHLAIEEANDNISFVFYKVTEAFCPKSCFSTLDLRLAECLGPNDRPMAMRVRDMFSIVAGKVNAPKELQFITNCKSKKWPPNLSSTHRESDVMITLCSEIFTKLSSEVILERSYSRPLRERRIPELQVGDIGLGSVNTWHGTPDARIRGMDVVRQIGSEEWVVGDDDSGDEGSTRESNPVSKCVSSGSMWVDDAEESDHSTGNSTAVEGKVKTGESNLPQAVGTCVVASFTGIARHPDQKPMVPTVLIGKQEFRIILYDCVKDLLLISDSKSLATKGGTLSRSGMALLWLTLNHRHFLQEMPTTVHKCRAEIASFLNKIDRLDSFKSLKSNDINWNTAKESWRVKSGLPVEYALPPPSKRRKHPI